MESDTKDAGWFTLRNFSIFMAALAAVWFAPVLFGGQSFVYRDFAYFGYPMAFHHRDAFWQGELPLWNPLNHCGLPFLAQWNSMTLYPGSFIYLLPPPLYGTNLFSIVHLWLAGAAMFWLAREWFGNGFASAVAGVGFAISGLTLNGVLWPNNMAALGWMPLVVGLACGIQTRRNFVCAITAGAMQMLTGAPEIILLTWAVIFVLVTLKAVQVRQIQPLLGLFGLGFFVAALCAAQLLPFLDLARISQRDANFGGSFWAMPLWGWASFFVPLVYTYDLAGVRFQYEQLWTSTYYPSIALTLLALVGLFGWRRLAAREKALYGIVLFSIALAMGPAAHVYSLLKSFVPGLGLIRFPIKFVVPVLFCLPLLAAAVIARVPELLRAPARKYAWMLIVASIVGVVSYAKGHPKFDPPYDNWPLTLRSGLITLFFASAAAALFANQHVAKLRLVVILLIPLDVYLHTPNPARTVDRGAFAPFEPPPVSRQGRAMLTKRAWDTLYNEAISDTRKNLLLNRVALNADLNLIERVSKIDGFFSLNMAESERLRNQLYAKGQGNLDAIMDFMGVTNVTSLAGVFDWTNRTTAMPLITAGQSPRTLEETNVLNALFSPRFNPRAMVLFSKKMEGYETNAVEAKVFDAQISRHRIRFAVEAPKATWAVIAQSFNPNWRATVNGNLISIERANYSFQAIPIKEGHSEVEIWYEDRSLNIGMLISGAALLALLAVTMRAP